VFISSGIVTRNRVAAALELKAMGMGFSLMEAVLVMCGLSLSE
jgi:hypothetical protein